MAKGKGLMLIDLVKNDEVVGVAAIGNQPLTNRPAVGAAARPASRYWT
jgi:hypothetical protein